MTHLLDEAPVDATVGCVGYICGEPQCVNFYQDFHNFDPVDQQNDVAITKQVVSHRKKFDLFI